VAGAAAAAAFARARASQSSTASRPRHALAIASIATHTSDPSLVMRALYHKPTSPPHSLLTCARPPGILSCMKRPTVLAVLNQKGGVGKTTTVASLGPSLAHLGRRTLLLELDPQECLAEATSADPDRTPYTTHLIERAAEADAAQEVRPNLHVVAAGPDLAEREMHYVTQPLRAIEGLPLVLSRAHYDCILIDCPPSLGIFTSIALAAATHILVPVATSAVPVRRLPATLAAIDAQRSRRARLYGILPTMYAAHLLHHQEALDTIRARHAKQTHVFDPIPRTVRLEDAVAKGEAITDRNNPASDAYRRLAERISRELL
jgi:chromosome partitioning protein